MNYNLLVITQPESEPVDYASGLRDYLRLTDNQEKDVVEALGKAARKYIESQARLTMVTTVFEVQYDSFDSVLRLPARPVLAAADVASVKYLDSSGVEQTLSTDSYSVDIKQPYSSVVIHEAPSDVSTKPNAVRIRFTAGFGDAAEVPEDLKLLIKTLASANNENREPFIVGKTVAVLPFGFDVILSNYSAPEAR